MHSSHFQRKNYFYLEQYRSVCGRSGIAFFTGKAIKANGICGTIFFAIKSKNTGTSFGVPVSFEIKLLCLRMGGIVAQGAFADLFQRLLAEDVLCLAGVLGGGLLVHAQLHKEVG